VKRLFALFAAAILVSACGDGGPLAPTATGWSTAGAFTVSGEVAEAGGRPIEGAVVEISSGIEGRSATSESSGSYSVQGLPPGRWTLTVSKEGYDSQSIGVDVTKDMTVSFELTRIPGRHGPASP